MVMRISTMMGLGAERVILTTYGVLIIAVESIYTQNK